MKAQEEEDCSKLLYFPAHNNSRVNTFSYSLLVNSVSYVTKCSSETNGISHGGASRAWSSSYSSGVDMKPADHIYLVDANCLSRSDRWNHIFFLSPMFSPGWIWFPGIISCTTERYRLRLSLRVSSWKTYQEKYLHFFTLPSRITIQVFISPVWMLFAQEAFSGASKR